MLDIDGFQDTLGLAVALLVVGITAIRYYLRASELEDQVEKVQRAYSRSHLALEAADPIVKAAYQSGAGNREQRRHLLSVVLRIHYAVWGDDAAPWPPPKRKSK